MTLLVAGPSLALALLVGSDFMPQLDEGAFLLQTVLPTEASLDEVDRLNHRVEDILREVPEIEDVVRRTGPRRAHRGPDAAHAVGRAGDAEGRSRSASWPRSKTTCASGSSTCPGIAVLFTTPLGMRIDEGLGGTPADLSVRVFGPDLDELARLAEEAERIMAGVAGRDGPARRGVDRAAAAADRSSTGRPRRASGWRPAT